MFFILLLSSASLGRAQREKSKRKTLQTDIDALLALKDALQLQEVLLEWNDTSDPCGDGWKYVICDCDGFPDGLQNERSHCENYTATDQDRIVYLELREGSARENYTSLPDALGNLTELRWLAIDSFLLNGSLPETFANLTQLRYLSLAENTLTGELPDFLADLEYLKTLKLHANNFTGEIPKRWCKTDWGLFNPDTNETTFTIHENPFLCGKRPMPFSSLHTPSHTFFVGKIPKCAAKQLTSIVNTWLYNDDFEALKNEGHRGDCDSEEPVCNSDMDGCRIRTPEYWTNPENINFNFIKFEDPESGIDHYEFSIGRNATTTNDTYDLSDILPMPEESTDSSNPSVDKRMHSLWTVDFDVFFL